MTELRNQTVENIINASNVIQVEEIIDASIKTLRNNSTNDFIIIRFLSKLETLMIEMKTSAITQNKIENLKEAICCINNHELNKIKSDI
ncbi:MAG: hypothetical protein K8R85_03440 [Bacteroidetes bacterium]|nr:hypothetical protein [Bacteroidota bacterium]